MVGQNTQNLSICPICNKEFVKSSKHRRYCSVKCAKRAKVMKETARVVALRAEARRLTICANPTCVNHLPKQRHKFCSDKCRKEAHKASLSVSFTPEYIYID